MNIVAVILAAGNSSRAGSPKALFRIGGKSFVRHIVDEYHAAGIAHVAVVLGAHADDIAPELGGTGAAAVVNHHYRSGQLSSVVEGVRAAERRSAAAILLHPVDQPLFRRTTVQALAARFAETDAPIILPVFEGHRGHPVLFSAALFEELKTAPPDVGARAVVWAHAAELIEVPVDDNGVTFNVNTAEDYEHLQSRLHGAA